MIPEPGTELAQVADDRPARWCYRCRRRHVHTWHLIAGGEWYEPTIALRCESCHGDHASFPGLDPDGPRPMPAVVASRLTAAMARRKAEAAERRRRDLEPQD